MGISLSTALSGISATQEKLRAAAQKTANQGTGDCRRLQFEAQTHEHGGVKALLLQLAATGDAYQL